MKLDQYDNIYFLGIGGIGMSALARWFMKKGLHVSGYDRTPTALTRELIAEGMNVHFEDDVTLIPEVVVANKARTLVVFTPAIPKDHKEHQYLKDAGYTIVKRSEVLGLLTQGYKTIAIAGTHGKTTTSSMVAHILKEAGLNMVAFLGGVTTNYNSNLVMQGEINTDTIVVVEADEYDRSFLRLFPNVSIITSADADHLDIYGDHQSVINSFNDFIGQIEDSGTLIIHDSVSNVLAPDVTRLTKVIYGMNRGQFFTANIIANSGFFEFDLHGFVQEEHIKLGVPGFHNVENAVAAAIAAHQCGVSMATIKEALGSFKGVKRRFEFIVNTEKVTYVDDYAHHPAEVEAFLTSMKAMYPKRKLTVIFQPHLFTRTRDFASEFARTLSLADELILMDIYPARELPIEGVDSDMIMNDVTAASKMRASKASLMATLEELDLDVVVTMGAGDIDTFIEPIKKMVLSRYDEV